MLDQPTMLSNPAAATVAFALSKGLPLERLVAATGIDVSTLLNPAARVDERVMPTVWRELREAFPGQAITLEMAAAAPAEFLGLFADAVRTAGDLREALELFVRFQAVLSSNVHLHTELHPQGLRLVLAHELDDLDDGCAAELALAVASRLSKEQLGLWAPISEVSFQRGPIGPIDAYPAFFNAPVHFHADTNSLLFREAALNRPIASYDLAHHRAIQIHLERARDNLVGSAMPAELARIRRAISEQAARASYDVEGLVKSLGMSKRTLQRRLKDHGTSTSKLLEEAREAHARELLKDPQLCIDEIAYLVGYATESSFRRAFQRWTGLSPARWRASAS